MTDQEDVVTPPDRRFNSFSDLQRVVGGGRPPGVETVSEASQGSGLKVDARLSPESPPDTVDRCREFLMGELLKRLPGAASADLERGIRPGFRCEEQGADSLCTVRVVEGLEDQWMARLILAGSERWVSEVRVSATPDSDPVVGFRAFTREAVPGPDPRIVPEILASVAQEFPLLLHDQPVSSRPTHIASHAELDFLLSYLLDPERRLSAVVATIPHEGEDPLPSRRRVDALARALTGTATVFTLASRCTYLLSDKVGKQRSVYGGAWRLYLPGFSPMSNQYHHPLYLGERVRTPGGAAHIEEKIRREILAAMPQPPEPDPDFGKLRRKAEALAPAPPPSRRRTAGVRATASKSGFFARFRELFRRRGGPKTPTDGHTGTADNVTGAVAVAEDGTAPGLAAQEEAQPARPPAAARGGGASRPRRPGSQRWRTKASNLRKEVLAATKERDRATERLREVLKLVPVLGENADASIPFPIEWSELADWCEEHFEQRLVLLPSARSSIGRALYSDVGMAARCIFWLATSYRIGRLRGNAPDLSGAIDELPGVHNQPCGGDTFDVQWNGTSRKVEWHLKSGGNTRDPGRCLRIYYLWDPVSRKVVVADMPAHRRSAAS